MTRKLTLIRKDWHTTDRAAGEPIAQVPANYIGAKMLTVKEAAAEMRRSEQGVLRLIRAGRLWAQPDGHRYLIPKPAIEDYYANERRRRGIA